MTFTFTRCALHANFLLLAFLLRPVLLPHLDVAFSSLAGRYSLDVTADGSRSLRAAAAPLILDHLEVVRQQSMTSNRAVVGNPGEGTNYACANEEGEVEAILRVPFRG